jgi:hypothetical protein
MNDEDKGVGGESKRRARVGLLQSSGHSHSRQTDGPGTRTDEHGMTST